MSRRTAPNLAVIDGAIDNIRQGSNSYSCTALISAAEDLHIHRGCSVYLRQYLQLTLAQNNGREPDWWNSPSPYKRERIRALMAFKAACIKAGKDLAKKKAAKA